ncbi:MAG: hypothetical protein AAF694_05990 [Bacteroidota bacterium]
MIDIKSLQKRIFKQIREQLPEHLALVDEVSDLLGISSDSAYRRIRGEKQLLLEELYKLCVNFKLSVDSFIKNPIETLPFTHVSVDEDIFTLEDYLSSLLDQAKVINENPDAELVLIANDLTMFQLLQIPELAAFKLFFWLKTSLGFSGYKHQKFSIEAIPPSMISISKDFVKEYMKINTIEIIGIDAVNSFLRQISYYLQSGFFANNEDALLICDKLLGLVKHFHHEADLGYKFQLGEKPSGKPGNFTMYYNELFVIDGLVLLRLDEERFMTYIASGPLNYVATPDQRFYENKYKWTQNLMKRSILLSGLSERMRNEYFLKVQEKIKEFREQILST